MSIWILVFCLSVPLLVTIALYAGGYGDVLCVQQKRNVEGERMKKWAEVWWRNRRLSLAEALDMSESSSKVMVVDTRICRAL